MTLFDDSAAAEASDQKRCQHHLCWNDQARQHESKMIKRILFVCTGNICRSPMAQALFQDMVGKEPFLRSAGIELDSAGTSAWKSSPASPAAIQVMREYGLDLGGFQAKPLDNMLIRWADLLLVMEEGHKAEVIARFPEAASKTHTLSEYVGEAGDVPDPIGYGVEVYRGCAALLQSLLIQAAERLKGSVHP